MDSKMEGRFARRMTRRVYGQMEPLTRELLSRPLRGHDADDAAHISREVKLAIVGELAGGVGREAKLVAGGCANDRASRRARVVRR